MNWDTATQPRRAVQKHAKNVCAIALAALALLPGLALAGQNTVGADSTTRTFRMGFTGFVYDFAPEAVNASRQFVRENGDILAHHIEGVPWGQVVNGQTFPKALLDEWEGKKLATPLTGKVYLAISPGRGELKMADKAGSLPTELKGKSYDDPVVMKAYLNYCRRAIEFFKPDYLAIGIDGQRNHLESMGRLSMCLFTASMGMAVADRFIK